MTMKRNRQKIKVYRITMDERISENLFRFLICQLKEDITKFIDHLDAWTEEKERIVNPTNYTRTLHIQKREAPIWESLEEGQVYISGQFKPVGEPSKPNYFIIDPDTKNFLRIDNLPLIREGVVSLYSDVLKGSLNY
jgi:hypothetical protein